MKIYVIRHGLTDINVENKINSLNDDDLNEIGIKQAIELRNLLKKIDYEIIISSPLTRTKHTAELLNEKNVDIIFDSRLLERDAGVLTKASLEHIDSDDWWNVSPKKDYENAEKVTDVLNRVYDFLDDIKRRKEKSILLVTHGGVSKAITCYFKGIPEDGNLEKYTHDNCEINEFEI